MSQQSYLGKVSPALSTPDKIRRQGKSNSSSKHLGFHLLAFSTSHPKQGTTKKLIKSRRKNKIIRKQQQTIKV